MAAASLSTEMPRFDVTNDPKVDEYLKQQATERAAAAEARAKQYPAWAAEKQKREATGLTPRKS